jgi:hypothetical protein
MVCGKNPQALLHWQCEIADCERCTHVPKIIIASIAVNDDLASMS